MTNISAFTYEGGEKISVQTITQDITKAVRAADLNGIAQKLNEIITVVNDMRNTPIVPDPSVNYSISGITVNGTEAEIQNGIARITITDNDSFTTEYQEKLEGIEAGAEVNKINAITVNGTEVTPDTNKIINIDMLDENISGSSVNYKLKNNTFTTCSDVVSSLALEVPNDICAMFQFTASTDFNGGTLTIPSTYFINNQISFDGNKTYLVSVDHNVIIWNEIEQYTQNNE